MTQQAIDHTSLTASDSLGRVNSSPSAPRANGTARQGSQFKYVPAGTGPAYRGPGDQITFPITGAETGGAPEFLHTERARVRPAYLPSSISTLGPQRSGDRNENWAPHRTKPCGTSTTPESLHVLRAGDPRKRLCLAKALANVAVHNIPTRTDHSRTRTGFHSSCLRRAAGRIRTGDRLGPACGTCPDAFRRGSIVV